MNSVFFLVSGNTSFYENTKILELSEDVVTLVVVTCTGFKFYGARVPRDAVHVLNRSKTWS